MTTNDSMFAAEPADSVTPEIRERVYEAITFLSSVCDGAVNDDDQGFNAMHAPFGNMIAQLRPARPRCGGWPRSERSRPTPATS
jgi:hypothetical protein